MKKIESLKNYIVSKKIFLLAFILILFILSLPLMQYRVSVSDDYLFHFSRIQSLTDALKHNVFPVKIHFPMANNCGYGVGFFYPNHFLYIPAIINLLISNLAISFKIFTFLILTTMFLLNYFSIKTVSKNEKVALLATVLIMCSNGLILNLYDRTALGELIGFTFITAVVCGMYNYVYDDFDKPYLLAIGFLGMANSHLITTFICIIFSILYFIINIKSSIRNPKKVFKLIITATIVILLSTSFWFPMIEQMKWQKFKLSEPWTHIENDSFTILDLFGTGRFSIGMIFTVFVPLLIYSLFDKNLDNKKKIFPLFALSFIFLMIFSPFWNLTNRFSNIIQFKWRLLGITTILSSISISILVEHYSHKFNFNFNYIAFGISIIALILLSYHLYSVIKVRNDYKGEYIETILYEIPESIGGGQEYLPLETDYDYLLKNSYIATINEDIKTSVSKENYKASFFLEQSFNAKTVEVPLIYYLGYVSNITSPEGTVVPLPVEKTERGLIKLTIPEGIYGTVNVWYEGTHVQTFSYIVSFLTLITVCIGFIIFKIIKYKKAV